MEKKYRYTLACEEFVAGSGYRYQCVMVDDYTSERDWNLRDFCTYILGEASEEYLLAIINNEKENGIDRKYTYSTYRYIDDHDETFDDGDPLFTLSFWESDAAKKIIGKEKLKEVGYEIDD